MSEPCKITVERVDSQVVMKFANATIRISEDTAQVLGRAMQMVAFGEKTRLTVYEETSHRPAGLYSESTT